MFGLKEVRGGCREGIMGGEGGGMEMRRRRILWDWGGVREGSW